MAFPQVVKEGYMERLSTILKRWKTCYCYLYTNGEFVYHDSKGGSVDGRFYVNRGGLEVHLGTAYKSAAMPPNVEHKLLVFVEKTTMTETFFLCQDTNELGVWNSILRNYILGTQPVVQPQPSVPYPGIPGSVPPTNGLGSQPAPLGFNTNSNPPIHPPPYESPAYPPQTSAYPAQPPSGAPLTVTGQVQPTGYPTQPPPTVNTQYAPYPGSQPQYPATQATGSNMSTTTTVYVNQAPNRYYRGGAAVGMGVGMALGAGIGLAATASGRHRHHHHFHHGRGFHHHHSRW